MVLGMIGRESSLVVSMVGEGDALGWWCDLKPWVGKKAGLEIRDRLK